MSTRDEVWGAMMFCALMIGWLVLWVMAPAFLE